MSIGLVPFSIWVWSVESILSPRGAVQPSKIHDNDVSLSYGQVRFENRFDGQHRANADS